MEIWKASFPARARCPDQNSDLRTHPPQCRLAPASHIDLMENEQTSKNLATLTVQRKKTTVLFLFVVVLSAWTITGLEARADELMAPVEKVVKAPDLDGIFLLDSRQLKGEELAGKVLMVNFWATWCPPCVKEFPAMQQIWETYDRDDFEIVAINVAEKPNEIERFFERSNIEYEFLIGLDLKMSALAAWQVKGLPTTFLVDRDRNIRYVGIGSIDYQVEEVTQYVSDLVNAR